ncbi:MAG: uroporphyrinogen decarboxylase [Pseudomonadota bacterium]
MAKRILSVLNGDVTDRVPFWFMRQAGRYLPEYRDLRAQAGGFLNLAYNPENASEVTVQPIRRYGMDAAILFSDILVILHALGQNLEFVAGEGPKLAPIRTQDDIDNLSIEQIDQTLSPVYETVSLTRQKLEREGFDQTALIGFAGSPWTVACYMVQGSGSRDFALVKDFAKAQPEQFQKIIDLIAQATIHYLSSQVQAGAEALKLFDSWSGLCPEEEFTRWVIEPTKKIIAGVKEKHPHIPIIGFPRGAAERSKIYLDQTGISAIGLDTDMNRQWAKDHLQTHIPVQGNLDPEALLAGGAILENQALEILETFHDKPFIFNLGHGVIKETPPEHVDQLCQIIRDFKA